RLRRPPHRRPPPRPETGRAVPDPLPLRRAFLTEGFCAGHAAGEGGAGGVLVAVEGHLCGGKCSARAGEACMRMWRVLGAPAGNAEVRMQKAELRNPPPRTCQVCFSILPSAFCLLHSGPVREPSRHLTRALPHAYPASHT